MVSSLIASLNISPIEVTIKLCVAIPFHYHGLNYEITTDPSTSSSTSNWEIFMENSLTNEPTTKQAYQDAITKGNHLLTMMHATDDQIFASSFNSVADLARHGYNESSWSGGTEGNEMKDLAPVFHGLNVGVGWAGASGSNVKIQHNHERASGSEKDVRYPVSLRFSFSLDISADENSPPTRLTLNTATPPTAY